MVPLIHYISDIWIYKATTRFTHVYVRYVSPMYMWGTVHPCICEARFTHVYVRHGSPMYMWGTVHPCICEARFTHVYVRHGILLTCGKRFHDYIIVNKTSLTLPLFIKMRVPIHESEWSCIYVLGVLHLTLAVWYVLFFNSFKHFFHLYHCVLF
jgi:hypothetical protein